MSQGSKDQSEQKPSLQMWVTPLFPVPHKKKKKKTQQKFS